jgi:hypothetical protein
MVDVEEQTQKAFQSAARIRSFVKGKLGFARE